MKRERPPIFRSNQTVYCADTCEPLVTAAKNGDIDTKSLVHGHYPGTTIPKEILPGLKMLGFWNATVPQNWGLPWHRNEGLEISFQASGNNVFSTLEAANQLNPGDLAISCPWQLHKIGNPNISVGLLQWMVIDVGGAYPNQRWKWPHWIILTDSDKEKLADLIVKNPYPVIRPKNKKIDTWNRLFTILKKNENDRQFSQIAIVINEILFQLIGILETYSSDEWTETSLTIRLVQSFIKELQMHPGQLFYQWTLPEMAKQCGLSISSFGTYFRQLTNMSPKNFLNKLRIEYAAQLLSEHPEVAITELALDCGFASSQYFATVFKKYIGKSPKAFLNQS
ncbi:MAG: helix-turn-helix transcriptional regulator [Thermoguttaceae bacterium]